MTTDLLPAARKGPGIAALHGNPPETPAHNAQFIHAALHRLSAEDRARRGAAIDASVAASEAKRRLLAGRL